MHYHNDTGYLGCHPQRSGEMAVEMDAAALFFSAERSMSHREAAATEMDMGVEPSYVAADSPLRAPALLLMPYKTHANNHDFRCIRHCHVTKMILYILTMVLLKPDSIITGEHIIITFSRCISEV